MRGGPRVTTEIYSGLDGERVLAEWRPEGTTPRGFEVRAVILGRDPQQLALEVVVVDVAPTANPSRETLGVVHQSRLGRRAVPVLVFARSSAQGWFFGPNAQAAVVGPLPVDQAQRIAQTALDEPSGLAARHRLTAMFHATEATKPGSEHDYLPGISNSGLFATHELRHGVPSRTDWANACQESAPLLGLRREELIEELGYWDIIDWIGAP